MMALNRKGAWTLASAVLIGFVVGCAKPTTLTVKSDPTNARVTLKTTGVDGNTDSILRIPDSHFAAARAVSDEAVFSLHGYRDVSVPVTLRKGRKNATNPPVVTLPRLDTGLEFDSEPGGAHVELSLARTDLPAGWRSSFTTPATFECTAAEAALLAARGLSIRVIEKEGYRHPKMKLPHSLRMEAGTIKRVTIPLRPILTSLQVITTPPGAIVEDIAPGGFGYLGETPLNRNFTWEDVEVWANRQQFRHQQQAPNPRPAPQPMNAPFEVLKLSLRISSPGRADVFVNNLHIPVGETRSFHRELKAVAGHINFASDPVGVHVYVQRSIQKTLYDQASGKLSDKDVAVLIHLGSTPFTFNVDPADPLSHGETFVFQKSGYRVNQTLYAQGQDSYHIVMEPVVHQER